mmetsp:Transcript_23524/g.39846  ORF Transcript_23524/g.39846 Transcript_23524/m.39846 type:complete len:85 (-) Transcript_23524:42-296(-)|eukprot:CAMPEP_0171650966 /NCGR_PEP_ID=MMETSP0990-20121206/37997_1 /TAXON_ID=483369 /ORGANISM="non described non described, Strain CCMP2098" /LENGTH=84 /DNA_ID=CAMNT_0012229743 /DNA_START=543 /DNA_END=797 /DNA_ORIENTATION=+
MGGTKGACHGVLHIEHTAIAARFRNVHLRQAHLPEDDGAPDDDDNAPDDEEDIEEDEEDINDDDTPSERGFGTAFSITAEAVLR